MQTDDEVFDRRHFLRWSAKGFVAAGVSLPTFEGIGQGQPQDVGSANAPEHTIVLRSSDLEVVVNAANGLPFEYRHRSNNACLAGEDTEARATALICNKATYEFMSISVTPAKHSAAKTTAQVHFAAEVRGAVAASFDLFYRLNGATFTIDLGEIQEDAGFELIEVALPCLASVRESDSAAWLMHGDQGGSFTWLKDANPGSLAPNRFWGSVLGTLPVVMIGKSDVLCVQETTAFMDGTTLAVAGDAGPRRATLGTIKVHRVNGSACYDLNLPRGMPTNCGTRATPNLLVEQTSKCRLDFLPVRGDPAKAWIAAGKVVRDRMPEIPSHFYDDKYVYGIRCDEPLFPAPSATFEQCHEMIARVAALTDGAPQVVHLWGWQFRGKDSGYPAVNQVNERIGGYDGMTRLMEQGEALNATVTLSDNYDDAYRSSPAWDESIIARRPDGQLWKSRPWTGEESYILGLAKYMEGPGSDRVGYTCERYRLRHTTHVDVLSYYAIRNDWDPQHPASGIRNLLAGRYKVLQEFAARGVDVSSEALRYPMIGHMSCFWYLTGPAPCPFGGTPIPLVPLIYGKSAIWGLSGPATRGDAAATRILERFYGACSHSILRADTDASSFLDAFYLGMVPFFLLRGKTITDFDRDDDRTRIHLEGGILIESSLTQKSIRILMDDTEVLRDDAVYCPIATEGSKVGRIACYSITPRTVTVKLPTGWQSEQVVAMALFEKRREVLNLERSSSAVAVRLEERRPVMLYSHDPESGHEHLHAPSRTNTV
jgi:hypothetical protein